jgi:hypothetical protein
MIDKYKKGRRVYTHWDKNTEQVTILPKNKPQPPVPDIAVEVPQEIAAGKRANFFVIHSSPDEFVLDLGVFQPGTEKVKLTGRVLLSPRTAKKLMLSLEKHFK